MKAAIAIAALLMLASQLASAQSSVTSQDLGNSQMCAKAARDFRNQPEWKESPQSKTFTNHFNKKLGKCLVKVSSQSLVKAESRILETQHVYDALEGTVLGGKIVAKELPRGTEEPKVLSILMVRDGKQLGKNNLEEARAAYQWFDTLMVD